MHTVTLRGFEEPFVVGKILCVGRNYAEHAKEMKSEIPREPVIFLKPSTAIVQDGGTVVIPAISRDVHHEVELTVLVGKGGKNIPRETALGHVAGYGIGLDMTLRDVQAEAKKKSLPWTMAKGFDASAPVSEFVSASGVGDPHALDIQLDVNGSVRQRSNTRFFIFRIDELISFISRTISLECGDVLFTGTPEGVGQVVTGDKLNARLTAADGSLLTSLTVSVI
ncbi:MAG: fumarylacetoacetate hydrolase family protein [Ignavibacteriales bacterium]|nr:fumarylacetoacetate hydrolase family protein [Ignavibacteriales bacterium]